MQNWQDNCKDRPETTITFVMLTAGINFLDRESTLNMLGTVMLMCGVGAKRGGTSTYILRIPT